jgi:hypothetical protein
VAAAKAAPQAAPRTAAAAPAPKAPEAAPPAAAEPPPETRAQAQLTRQAVPPAALSAAQAQPEPPLPDAAAALTPDVIQQVLGANRQAFAACAAQAGPDQPMDGRRVTLKLTVGGTGAVSYPTLDDQSLSQTPLGQCLKNAARAMVFPRFRGDPSHLEVPLTLTR